MRRGRILGGLILAVTASGLPGATPPATPPETSMSLADGLVLYYSFDVDEAGTVADASGGELHGTKQRGGPAIVPGKFSRAAQFAGGANNSTSAPYLDLSAHAGALANLEGGTISAWIKPETDHVQDVLTIFAASDSGDGSSEVRLFVSNGGAFGSGRLAYGVRNDGSTRTSLTAGTDGELFDGRWHHIALVVDGGAGETRLFLDGVQVSSGADAFLGSVNGIDTIALGRNVDNGGANGQWFYDGGLDEFAIWNRPLTADEVLALAGADVAPPSSPESVFGNSVDAATGAFVRERSVMKVEGVRVVDFPLRYNSQHTSEAGALGMGWSHRYEARLAERRGLVSVYWTPNLRSRFRSEGGSYVPIDAGVRHASLEREVDQHWVLTELDGTRWEFDKDSGQLREVANKIGQRVVQDYSHDDPTLLTTVLAVGTYFELAYDASKRLTTLSDELGREVQFRYDAQGRLAAVTAPFIPDSGGGVPIGEFFPPKDIPDNGVLVHTLFAGDVGAVEEITLLDAFIGHQRPSDLTVTLISPAGTEVILEPNVPSAGFLDFTGQVLDDFRGEQGNGEWQVVVRDSVPGVSGELSGWQMRASRGVFNEIRYSYDDAGRIVRAEDIKGKQRYANTYDALGRVTGQDDGLASSEEALFRYVPFPGGHETRYTDRAGHRWTLVFDAAQRLLAAFDPLGIKARLLYNESGDRTDFIDALGNIYQFEYDEPDYGERGHLSAMVDPAGHRTTFVYDRSYNDPNNPADPGQIVGNPAGNLVRILDAQDRYTTFVYNQFTNNVREVIDDLNQKDTKTYNSFGQIDGNLRGAGGEVNYLRDENGRVTGIMHATGGSTSITYDPIGRIVSFSDPDGFTSTTAYSSTDRIIEQTDGLGQAVRSVYDYRGRLVRKIDRNGTATAFSYDDNNNLKTVTNALGEVTSYSYDAEDRLVAATDARGNTRTFTFDSAGRLVAHSDGLGNTTTRGYDANGNLTHITNPEGTRVLEVTYDSRGLPVESRDAMGHVTTAAYDELGRRIEVTDPLGHMTEFHYDRLGRMEQAIAPDDREATQTFTSDDLVRSIENAAGAETSFVYDIANRLEEVTTELGHQTQLSYNGRGFVSGETFPSLKRIDYAYDGAGRLLELMLGINFTRFYEYDANGNLLTIATRSGPVGVPEVQTTRTYDALDRLASYTDAAGNTIGYEYDAAGNVSRLVYPDGAAVDYEYDAADRLVRVTDWAGRMTEYSYDRSDRITAIEFPNGAIRLMSYDEGGRVLTRRDFGAQGQQVSGFDYSYDAGGRMVSESPLHPTTPYVPSLTEMEYDGDNRLTSFNGEAVVADADGNLRSGLGFGNLIYDPFNNLIVADDYRYYYDAEDRLVGWERAGQRTDLVVNPGQRLSQVLMKTDPDGTVTRYVYGVGLIYQETEGQTRTFHYDHRGSTVALSGDDGMVAGRIDYGPFGELGSRVGDTDTIFLFNGLFGVIESPQGLKHMRFRWYVPEARRFLNQDAHFGTIASLATLNRYAFAGNNPITQLDPRGEFINLITALAGAAVGAAADTIATFVTDVIDDGRINTPWEDYVGAAIGGAVGGAIIGATGCIPCGGAAGSAVEYLTIQGLKGERVDPAELAIVTGIGAAVSVTFTGGEVFQKQLTKRLLAKEFAQDVAEGIATNLASGAALDALEASREELAPGGGGANLGPTRVGHADIFRAGQRELNRGSRGRYGEHAHWRLFQEALELAGRPAPNNPNNFLAGY